MNQATINIEQLSSALQRKGIPLPFEMGSFLVLEATEQVLVFEATEDASKGLPVLASGDVWLSEQGELMVEPSGKVGSEAEACRALLRMLSELLVRSATGVPAMLLTLAEHGPSEGQWTLIRLRDDLEASLVPLNRAAMRRVLSRLLRELQRGVERPSSAPAPNARAVDREVDAVLGIAPTPMSDEQSDEDESDDHNPWAAEAPTSPHARRARAAASAAAALAPRLDMREIEPAGVARPSSRARGALDDFEQESAAGQSSAGVWIGLGLVLLALALLAGYHLR